jgi:hypothetical protein
MLKISVDLGFCYYQSSDGLSLSFQIPHEFIYPNYAIDSSDAALQNTVV